MEKHYRNLSLFGIMSMLTLSSCFIEDINDLENRVDSLEDRVDNIESTLSDMSATISNLKEDGKLNTAEFESLNTSIEQLSDLMTQINDSSTLNHQLLDSLTSSLTWFLEASEFDGLKETIANLSSIIDGLQTIDDVNSTTINDLESSITLVMANLNIIAETDTYQAINGKIEKGAFVKGSLLFFYEMDSNLAQTGRSFNTTITDNFGSFELNARNLKGRMCRLIADGFYFNEVTGKSSSSRITLTGLTRIDSGEVINVNVLTHLERPRVEYLLSQGLTYDSAKHRALTDVLAVFSFQNPGLKRAEKIALIGNQEENKMLLAISTIIQGFRSESEVTELMNDIAEDLKGDGQISNVDLGNTLRTHAYYLDTTKIVSQVKNKYTDFYSPEIINNINLSSYANFEQTTPFTLTDEFFSYPEFMPDGISPNILHPQSSKTLNVCRSTIYMLPEDNTLFLSVGAVQKRGGPGVAMKLVDENGNSFEQGNPFKIYGGNLSIAFPLDQIVPNVKYSIYGIDNITKIKLLFYERGNETVTREETFTLNYTTETCTY